MATMFDSRVREASTHAFERFKGEMGSQPRRQIYIVEGAQTAEELTDKLITYTVTYDGQGGCSMTAVLDQRVAGFDGRDVVVRSGYGTQTDRIFYGRVTGYTEDTYTDIGTITASGLSVIRGKQRANAGYDYSNMNLRDAMFFIDGEATSPFGAFEMIGGEEYTIHDVAEDEGTEAETNQPGYGVFGSEATWTEHERTLLEPTKYIAYDNPHGHIIHPKPELRHGGDPVNYQWWWTPNFTTADYPRGGFTFNAGTRETYNRVIIFRRTQDYGEYITEDLGPGKPKRVREFYSVYAEGEVNRTGRYQMPTGTDDVIPDWNGTQAEAEAEVARRVAMHETVKGTFEWSGPLITFWPHDVVYIERVERRPGPRLAFVTGVPLPAGDSEYVRALYTCLVDGQISQTSGRAVSSSSISGQAALHSMAAVPNPIENQYRSLGLVAQAA